MPVRTAAIKKSTTNAGEGMEKREPSYTVGRNANQFSHYEEQSGDSLKKLEIELPYDPAIPPLGIHTKETRTERDMYPSVHRSTVYNSQDMEATQMSISRRMNKKAVVHTHNGVLLSH